MQILPSTTSISLGEFSHKARDKFNL